MSAASRTGNYATGERHGGARLTWQTVDQIRADRARGVTLRALATAHGVTASTIRRAAIGTNWKDTDRP